jgi:hypothetical protein
MRAGWAAHNPGAPDPCAPAGGPADCADARVAARRRRRRRPAAQRLQDQIQALGPWGAVLFVTTVALAEMVPLLPTQPLSLASGLLFGAKEVRGGRLAD